MIEVCVVVVMNEGVCYVIYCKIVVNNVVIYGNNCYLNNKCVFELLL